MIREDKKRISEGVIAIGIAILLLGLSNLESRLYLLGESLSQNREFITTLAYFGLININVILVLVLGFLIFRNVIKLVLERRHGVIGSKLRTKLTTSLVFFALAPTVLMFFVSMRYVTNSFEEWFSDKVGIAMQQTRLAGEEVYAQQQAQVERLARLALKQIKILPPLEIFPEGGTRILGESLKGFDLEFDLYLVKVFDRDGGVIWSSQPDEASDESEGKVSDAFEALVYMTQNPRVGSTGMVAAVGGQDVVRGFAPVFDPITGEILGAIMTELRFETQILQKVQSIMDGFSKLRPSAQLIRVSYLILMILMVLLITFSATWMGFYVAKGIIGPIHNLAVATREVALGNYSISLAPKTDDETGQLVRSFNLMTRDLQDHQLRNAESQRILEKANEELEQRRRYMEIVLGSISAGVVSFSTEGQLLSLNRAAARLLKIERPDYLDEMHITEVLGDELNHFFWKPIEQSIKDNGTFYGQIDLTPVGIGVILMVNVTQIHDERMSSPAGYVAIFDDVQEQIKAQKVAAWREVARRIAHEIKNPLTPIKLNTQRLHRKFDSKFEGEEKQIFDSCIDSILKQVDSLKSLVNEFSKFSKLPDIVLREGDINAVVEESLGLYLNSYPDVKFYLELSEKLPTVNLDEEQLGRAIVNLIGNAIGALVEDRPGEITCKTYFQGDVEMVTVEIQDNGIGIPKELRSKVLEPYFSTKSDGTGLGLAIVNQIITDHRGYFRLLENPPHGTKVVIELPISGSTLVG